MSERNPSSTQGDGSDLPTGETPACLDDPAGPRPSKARSFARGARLGLPVFLGYAPVGAAFGVVAVTTGLAPLEAVACSALVLAGAGQFIAMQLVAAGLPVTAVLLATGVVNLRYVLFSATMSPYLHESPRHLHLPLAFTLTDETFGINVTDQRQGTADDWSMIGVGFVSWAGWTGGTAVGAAATSLLADPDRYGVGFAMPAMFVALLVAQLTDKRAAATALIAAGLALALTPVLPTGWPPIAAALAAATAAAVAFR